MNDDTIADLKQFIATTISQQTSDIYDGMDDMRNDISEIRIDLKKLDQKVDDLSLAIGDTLDASNQETDTRLKDHDRRIAALEQHA